MSLKKQALSGMFWYGMQLFGNQGITFVVTMVLARLLVPAEFGLIAMISIFIGLGTALINGGMTQSLIRTPDADEEDFSTVFYFNLVGSILIYLIIFLCAPFIADFYSQEILTGIIRLYAVTFIINAFGAVQITRLTKKLDFKTQMRVSIPSLVLGSSIGISLAYMGFGVWSLVWSSLVQSAASTIQLWIWSKWQPLFIFNREKFKKHFGFGMKLMFSSILNTVFINIYTIVIGRFFAPAQVGFYNTANSLQKLPVGNISSIITKVSYPLFSSIQNDDVRLKNVYKRIMQMAIYLVAPILVFMTVLAEPLFRFLFTEKWLPAVPYFQILFINGLLHPIHAYNLQILNVKGRSDLFLKLEIFKKILVVVVLMISFKYGIFAMLYGSVICSILSFFINAYYSGKFVNYSAWDQTKDLLPIIVMAFFAGTAVFGLDHFISYGLPDLLRLIAGSALGVGIYALTSFLFRMESFFEIKNIVLRK